MPKITRSILLALLLLITCAERVFATLLADSCIWAHFLWSLHVHRFSSFSCFGPRTGSSLLRLLFVLVAACPSIFQFFLFWTENGIFSSPSPFSFHRGGNCTTSLSNIILLLSIGYNLQLLLDGSRLSHRLLNFVLHHLLPLLLVSMFLRSWHGNVSPCFFVLNMESYHFSQFGVTRCFFFFFELCPAVWVHAIGVHFFRLLELLLVQTLQHVVTRNFCTLVSGTSSHFVSRLCVLSLFNVTLMRLDKGCTKSTLALAVHAEVLHWMLRTAPHKITYVFQVGKLVDASCESQTFHKNTKNISRDF